MLITLFQQDEPAIAVYSSKKGIAIEDKDDSCESKLWLSGHLLVS
jgi:hypothetical protein